MAEAVGRRFEQAFWYRAGAQCSPLARNRGQPIRRRGRGSVPAGPFARMQPTSGGARLAAAAPRLLSQSPAADAGVALGQQALALRPELLGGDGGHPLSPGLPVPQAFLQVSDVREFINMEWV